MKVYVKIYESILSNPLLRIILSLKVSMEQKYKLICAEVTKNIIIERESTLCRLFSCVLTPKDNFIGC